MGWAVRGGGAPSGTGTGARLRPVAAGADLPRSRLRPCEVLLAAYGYLGNGDGDIQTMRDRLADDWGEGDVLKVRTIVALRPFKEPGDAERFAEGLRRAGLPEY